MKNVLKWIVTHEPALLAGLFVGAGVFLAVRYGTHTAAAVQALSGSSVALAFGTLRNFVTSPAGRKALTDAQVDLSQQLPALAGDFARLKAQLSTTIAPAIAHPAGLAGILEDNAAAISKTADDVLDRVRGMLRSTAPIAVIPAETPAEAVTAAPAPGPEVPPEAIPADVPMPAALAQLGQLTALAAPASEVTPAAAG